MSLLDEDALSDLSAGGSDGECIFIDVIGLYTAREDRGCCGVFGNDPHRRNDGGGIAFLICGVVTGNMYRGDGSPKKNFHVFVYGLWLKQR